MIHLEEHKRHTKTMPLFVDVVLIVLCVVVLALTAFVWRVSYAPLDIGFLKPFVENSLANKEAGRHVLIDGLVVHWPDFNEPMLLGLKGTKVLGDDGQLILAIDEIGLGISKRYLFLGKLRLKVLLLKRPVFNLVRTVNGDFDIGLGGLDRVREDLSSEQQVKLVRQEALLDRILGAISSQGAQDGTVLSLLKRIKVSDAELHFDDRLYGQRFYFSNVDASFAAGKVSGAELELSAELEGMVGKESLPHLYVKAFIDTENKLVNAQGSLKDFAVMQLAEMHPDLGFLREQEGALDIGFVGQFDEHLYPKALNLELSSDAGALSLPDLYDQKLPYRNFTTKFSFVDGMGEQLKLSESSVVLNDVQIDLSGAIEVKDDGAQADVRVDLPFVKHESIAPLWPKVLEGDNSELWVLKRLADGTFHESFAALKLRGTRSGSGWEVMLDDVNAVFNFKDMSIDYRAPMLPATKVAGQGRFEYKTETLDVDIDTATMGGLSLYDTKLTFANIITEGAGQADLNINVRGDVKDAIDYVALEPIGFKPKFDAANSKGAADMAIHLAFPAHPDLHVEDIKIEVDGTVADASIPRVVKDFTLGGGPFRVQIAENVFKASGKGTLDQTPIDFDYQTFLFSKGQKYKDKLKVTLQADESLRERFGIDLSDFVRGAVNADVTYTEYHDGRAEADIRADLTPAEFFISPFAYNKKSGLEAKVTLKASLHNNILQAITGLTGKAPDFSIQNAGIDFRQHKGESQASVIRLPSLQIVDTRGSGTMRIDPLGAQSIDFTASHFDLRPFVTMDEAADDRNYNAPPVQVMLSAKQLQLDDQYLMKDGKIVLDIDDKGSFNRLEMDAMAGVGAVYLRYKPDAEGKRVFRFEADDAGATLAALGVYDKMRGGKIVVHAEPITGVHDRNLIGVAEITDFNVVKAPALAQLLGVLSLGGIADLLGNEGLSFKKLEADFDWLYRPQGSLLVLENGRTSGSSIGLTFDGIFDQSAGTIDVSGTVVPMSSLNTMLSSIPIIGTILTGGGDGGVFAATYSMKGPAKDPKISVNPLSVLAPGIIRRILFE